MAYIDADAKALDIPNIKCEKLLEVAVWGTDGLAYLENDCEEVK